MAKYLKKFNNHSGYVVYITDEDALFPNVSYCIEDNETHFNPVKIDYSKEYFTFECLNAGTVTINSLQSGSYSFEPKTISYSVDNGQTWENLVTSTSEQVICALNTGDKLLIKGTNESYSSDNSWASNFGGTAKVKLYGNIMSLIYGDNFEEQTSFPSGSEYNFWRLFESYTNLKDVENLILPATTLAESCYRSMFDGCTSIKKAPELPATTLVSNCYSSMFQDCTSLNYIKAMFTTNVDSDQYTYTYNWVDNVSPSGLFVKNSSATWSGMGDYGIPNGWAVDFTPRTEFNPTLTFTAQDKVKFTSKEDNACIGLLKKSSNQTMYISKNGTDWQELTVGVYLTFNKNEVYYVCGTLTGNNSGSNYTQFSMGNYKIYASGNVNGLWDYTGSETTLKQYCGYKMFQNCTGLTTATNLPATTLATYCYYSMFQGCTSLTTAPTLPSTTLGTYCYQSMFQGCTSLTTAPNLPATTLVTGCYEDMFQGCTSLTTAPNLPATTLASYCYQSMFEGCTGLTTAPNLPATTLVTGCYQAMFSGCTRLTTAPELPATTMKTYCYGSMFRDCTSLTTAPTLPATKLDSGCYGSMFYGCTSLTTAPELPATTLVSTCYGSMFQNCSKLNYIKALFKTAPSTATTKNWVDGVASSGTFVKNPAASWDVTGVNGVPSGWIVDYAYNEFVPTETFTPSSYVTFTSNQNNSVFGLVKKSSNRDIYISKNGTNWQSINENDAFKIDKNEFFYACGYSHAPNTSSLFTTFLVKGSVAATGNCHALVNYDNVNPTSLNDYEYYQMFSGCTGLTTAPALPATTLGTYCYYSMFQNCTGLTTAPALPATTLGTYCYQFMFENCTGLTTAPTLPAASLASYCYSRMFQGCTSLTTAPELSATTLATYCYEYMFQGCTSLVNAPELPATSLNGYCYQFMFENCTGLTTAPTLPATSLGIYCYKGMFQGCTSLTTAPNLPATTLASYCYQSMFQGCTSLTTAPNLPATTLATYCYQSMFEGCTGLTTAPNLPATTLATYCYQYMYYGCTSLTTVPNLPATTLANNCYTGMFRGCTSLVTAPELPATTLVSNCYQQMFYGCTSLNYIKAMFTTTPSTSYTRNWVSGVASSGTFVKNSSATWTTTGTNGVPSGWTVETASA